jgi:hypothetical protein
MLAADKDPNKIGEALSGMLNANIYLYARLDSPPEEVKLFQFHHPASRQLMVPFFSDETKAKENARGQVKVIPCLGRHFFRETLGSVLFLDPRERGFELYPNEIAALLAGTYKSGPLPTRVGDVGSVATADVPAAIPFNLARALRELYRGLPRVHACYVSMLHQEGGITPNALLVLCVADSEAHFEVTEATRNVIKPLMEAVGLPMDLRVLTPGSSPGGVLGWCLYKRDFS